MGDAGAMRTVMVMTMTVLFDGTRFLLREFDMAAVTNANWLYDTEMWQWNRL